MGTVDGGALFEDKTALSNPLYEYLVPGRPQLADLPPERGPRPSVSTVTWLPTCSLPSLAGPTMAFPLLHLSARHFSPFSWDTDMLAPANMQYVIRGRM
ncbi:hypothetical protein LX32DRAFT_641092 [Colletotrichum zoysiae]|uniref:Uncharacterized protein n=1 Tax=Colletotrichum zoysiae TaxID=1216348 RepID=A0AAD9HE83_9PEZI|nr:hypothetical protein LX32DRAFT_641092 [Colletotrichum zoysiae]